MNPINVVAAIIRKDDFYLLAKRNKDKYMGLKWEFPGGKVEENETFKEALSREILEELNVNVDIHNKIAEESYQDDQINIVLHYFLCSPCDAVERSHSERGSSWVPVSVSDGRQKCRRSTKSGTLTSKSSKRKTWRHYGSGLREP